MVLHKILLVGQWMANLQNGVETLSKFSTASVGCTDDRRQTDRQTELRLQIPERDVTSYLFTYLRLSIELLPVQWISMDKRK